MSFSADDTIHKPLEVGELLGKDPSTTAFDETMKFVVEKEKTEAGKIFDAVYAALKEIVLCEKIRGSDAILIKGKRG